MTVYTLVGSPQLFGYIGLVAQATGTPFVDRIASVDDGSPAARAGVREGDLVEARLLPPPQRYLWNATSYFRIPGENLEVGIPFDLTLLRGSQTLHARVAPVLNPDSFGMSQIATDLVKRNIWSGSASLFSAGIIGNLWTLLLCVLIVWRRADNVDACLLVLTLVAQVMMSALRPGQWRTGYASIDVWADAFYSVTLTASHILPLAYVLRRAGGSAFVRGLVALACVVSLVHLISYTVDIAGSYFGWLDLASLNANGIYWNAISLRSAGDFMSAVCLVAAIPAAQRADRTAVAWVALAIAPFMLSVATFWFVVNDAPFYVSFFQPAILMYALLSRRLLDVQFVLNRAAVFTGVSVVIVGIFVIVEWALSEWFSSISHTTNLAISAALALALGLSVRAIHTRVDRVLDTVFFRKRHEDEQAIRMLAREAAYITDVNVLLSRVVTTMEGHADATSADVLLDSGGIYNTATNSGLSVSENDPAIVRLRATRSPLDLHDVRSAIQGEFAYPMLARGRLVGVLILGPKRSGETYAPDESDAILQLAHDTGSALDVLLRRSDAARDTILEEIWSTARATHEAIQTLAMELRSNA